MREQTQANFGRRFCYWQPRRQTSTAFRGVSIWAQIIRRDLVPLTNYAWFQPLLLRVNPFRGILSAALPLPRHSTR